MKKFTIKAGKRRPRWWWLPWVVLGRLKFGRVKSETIEFEVKTKWRPPHPEDGINDIWGMWVFNWKRLRWDRHTISWQFEQRNDHYTILHYSKLDGSINTKEHCSQLSSTGPGTTIVINYPRTSWLNFRFHPRMDTHEARHSDTVVTVNVK